MAKRHAFCRENLPPHFHFSKGRIVCAEITSIQSRLDEVSAFALALMKYLKDKE
jgi:hypothetical protein